MAWKYDGIGGRVLHVESQTEFGLHRLSPKLESPSDFDLVPPERSSRTWRPEELQQLKEDFWPEMKKAWDQSSLRLTLARLIRSKLGGDNFRAARVISEITKREVSARSIQAWLIDPLKQSSRTCPPWAVEALGQYSPPSQDTTTTEWSMPHSWNVRANRAVEYAENKIEADERLKKKWADANLSSLHEKLYELERDYRGWRDHFSDFAAALKTGLQRSESFEDFRKRVLAELNEASEVLSLVEDAKKAIQQGTGEFSNPDGLPRGADK